MRAWRGRTPRPRATTGLWSTTRLGKVIRVLRRALLGVGRGQARASKLASSWTTVLEGLPPARHRCFVAKRADHHHRRRPGRRAARLCDDELEAQEATPGARWSPPAEAAAADAEAARREKPRRWKKRDKHRVTDLEAHDLEGENPETKTEMLRRRASAGDEGAVGRSRRRCA